jgi:hypothetical protein
MQISRHGSTSGVSGPYSFSHHYLRLPSSPLCTTTFYVPDSQKMTAKTAINRGPARTTADLVMGQSELAQTSMDVYGREPRGPQTVCGASEIQGREALMSIREAVSELAARLVSSFSTTGLPPLKFGVPSVTEVCHFYTVSRSNFALTPKFHRVIAALMAASSRTPRQPQPSKRSFGPPWARLRPRACSRSRTPPP